MCDHAQKDGTIWHCDGTPNHWIQYEGALVRDIGVGADGSVWIVYGDRGIGQWNATESTWDRTNGTAFVLSVNGNGTVWVVPSDSTIYTATLQ